MSEAPMVHWWTDQACILDDARGLARIGMMAARRLENEVEQDAFAALFRALDDKLQELATCFEAAGDEMRSLKKVRVAADRARQSYQAIFGMDCWNGVDRAAFEVLGEALDV